MFFLLLLLGFVSMFLIELSTAKSIDRINWWIVFLVPSIVLMGMVVFFEDLSFP
jgi:hypothetical protein